MTFDPKHHYYSPDGEKITMEDWIELRREPTVGEWENPADGSLLRTVYLGFVDMSICDARLFGTAVICGTAGQPECYGYGTTEQVECYDSKADAERGHASHVEAIIRGYHCHRCQLKRPHD